MDPLRPGMGIVVNATTSDLLENHKIRGGFTLFTDLNNSDFFGEYQFLSRRFDISARFDRKALFFDYGERATGLIFAHKYALNKAMISLSYPITNTSRVSISPFYASTLLSFKGASPLQEHKIHYSGTKFEYVYDNTILNGQNMILGTRVKISYENFQTIRFNKGFREQIASNPNNPQTPKELSFDKISPYARKYIKIHRDLIFAVRVAYGRFGGKNPKSFTVGGMDNWIFNKTEGGSPLEREPLFDNSNLLFVEFVTNLRGYNYNKVSGQNYFLSNLELRFPIIKYLFGKRINSNFLQNLQLVGFYDVGSAWTGISPFNRESALNTRKIGHSETTFEAIVQDFKNRWLAGYGVGIRTVLLGYYLKGDLAWAVEDFIVAPKPKFYLTFGYDF